MMAKIALLLLVVLAVIALAGKWAEKILPRRKGPEVRAARKCPQCGAWQVEGVPCICAEK
ncbi:hypothetical protein FDP22_11215 [Paroceanicella profunda]|uniref:Uncharacterized protein n=1 Tax=Paroceanicella profunda TaxID=2579971 RepID=A0A5B8FV63_9RHOB|nr:hypothetical protein [Paroceanicella profunda]QDL92295.1 hypothetical protein FDP22_11215 [Paroceanicella profunda]